MNNDWAKDKIAAVLESKVKVEKPMTEARKKKIRAGYDSVFHYQGLNCHKLLDGLVKRGAADYSDMLGGVLKFNSCVPGQKRRLNGFLRTELIMELAENGKGFSVYLAAYCYQVHVQLHKPIIVPIEATNRKMAEALTRARDALIHGVYQVIGEKNLPGWPSDEKIERLRQASQANALNAITAFNNAGGVDGIAGFKTLSK